jgi:SHS family lactate transporter-like MFS transporter
MTPSTRSTRSDQIHAVAASFLGWTMDAFDYFVVVFLLDTLATEFGVSRARIVLTLTVTLAFRPVGAILFGLLSDRYGRRTPLMINVLFFSSIGLLCGFSTNYTYFLILRALYGIGMGGEWGVGASLAMEAAPKRWRGVLSGLLQSGYPVGYLLAAVAARVILPNFGWRWMFWIGALPALLAIYIRTHVPESEAWKQHRAPSTGAVLRAVHDQWKRILYLVILLVFMMFLSHGTQDLYPDFLGTVHGIAPATVSYIAIFYNVGAVIGAIFFGAMSERIGRRYSMIGALGLSLLVIPSWAFGTSVTTLAIGAFLMQAGVQGAWGIIPVHLNEMSHDSTRGLVPGLAYQLGVLFAAPTNNIEFALRDMVGYQWAIAGFEIVTIISITTILLLGTERRGRSFVEPVPVSPD